MAKQTIHHTNLEGRMEQTISDSKYWLEKYTSGFKTNDSKIGEMQGEFNGRMDTIFFQLSRRVTIDDMGKNFRKLSDILFVKFTQVEENKQVLKDMLLY